MFWKMKILYPLTFKRHFCEESGHKFKWKVVSAISSFKAKFVGVMKRGINGSCSQFCPTSPHRFCQFCGAGQGHHFTGRGSLFFRGAGWASLVRVVQVGQHALERMHRGPLYGYYGMCRLLFWTHTPSSTGDYKKIQRAARCLIALSDLWSFVCVSPNMKVTFFYFRVYWPMYKQ